MRALWYDDRVERTDYAELRQSVGLAFEVVDRVATEESFLARMSSAEYDLCLLDLELERRGGVDIARDTLTTLGDIPIVFLSEYLPRYPNYRSLLDPRARTTTVFKPLTNTSAWVDEELKPKVLALVSERPNRAREWEGANADVHIWSFTPEDFRILALDDQRDLLIQANEALRPFTNAVFEDSSAEFVVLIGPKPAVLMYGGLDASPPTEANLQQWETSYHVVPLVVYRPTEIEMVDDAAANWVVCSNASDREIRSVDVYPSLTLEINGHSATYHLDTGSVWTYLSYEASVEKGMVPRGTSMAGWSTQEIRIAGGSSPILFKHFEADISAASLDGFLPVRLNPRFVDGWRRTALARTCPFGRCVNSELVEGKGWYCGSRSGLIGRDLIRSNRLLLILDSIRNQTYVAKDAAQFGESSRPQSDWELF